MKNPSSLSLKCSTKLASKISVKSFTPSLTKLSKPWSIKWMNRSKLICSKPRKKKTLYNQILTTNIWNRRLPAFRNPLTIVIQLRNFINKKLTSETKLRFLKEKSSNWEPKTETLRSKFPETFRRLKTICIVCPVKRKKSWRKSSISVLNNSKKKSKWEPIFKATFKTLSWILKGSTKKLIRPDKLWQKNSNKSKKGRKRSVKLNFKCSMMQTKIPIRLRKVQSLSPLMRREVPSQSTHLSHKAQLRNSARIQSFSEMIGKSLREKSKNRELRQTMSASRWASKKAFRKWEGINQTWPEYTIEAELFHW